MRPIKAEFMEKEPKAPNEVKRPPVVGDSTNYWEEEDTSLH